MIKNQHGDSLDGIDASELRLILFAVPRSGSAWLWQMVGDVLGDGVFRTHRYVLCDRRVPVVVGIRDPRDCIVSHWRFHNNVESGRQMTEQEIFTNAEMYQGVFWALRRYLVSSRCVCFVRYEELRSLPGNVVKDVIKAAKLECSELAIRDAVNRYSIEKNREISDSGPCDERMLMRGHVRDGEVGSWRRFVDGDRALLLNGLLMEEIEILGYGGHST